MIQQDSDVYTVDSVKKLFNIFLLGTETQLISEKYLPELKMLYKDLMEFLKSYKKDYEQLKSNYVRTLEQNDRETESRITYMLKNLTDQLDKARDIIYEAYLNSSREIIKQ